MTTLDVSMQEVNALHEESLPTNSAPETMFVYRQAIVLGAVAGLRSMMPIALLTQAKGRNRSSGSVTASSFLLDSPALKRVTMLAAIGEVIGDKLPIIPSRLSPGSLAGRLVLGAVAGAILCRQSHLSPISGAALGAAGAGIGTIVGYSSRMLLSQFTNVPDFIWGSIEDGIALGLARLAVRKNNSL